jgi:hypothetical protein
MPRDQGKFWNIGSKPLEFLKNSKNKVCHSRILQGVDCREIER